MISLKKAVFGLIVGTLMPSAAQGQVAGPPPPPSTEVEIGAVTQTIQPNNETKYSFPVTYTLSMADTFNDTIVSPYKLPNRNEPLIPPQLKPIFSGLGGPPTPGGLPVTIQYHFFGPRTHRYEIIAQLNYTNAANQPDSEEDRKIVQ